MNNWLYPLSRKSGNCFVDQNGKIISDTSFESFKAIMRSPAPDDHWYLSTNYRQVQRKDRIWCYYGRQDKDQGIVGLATVVGVVHNERKGTHDVVLKWDKNRTARLLRNPVPASRVRQFILRPRAPVWNLDRHPRLVSELLSHAGIAPK